MKNNFKRTLSFLLAVLMLAGLLVPVTVQAQTYVREKKDKNLKESYTVIEDTNSNDPATGAPNSENEGEQAATDSHSQNLIDNKNQNIDESKEQKNKKARYISLKLINPGKINYKKGEALSHEGLLVEVTDSMGNKKALDYKGLLADKNINIQEISNKRSSKDKMENILIISASDLDDIVINTYFHDEEVKSQKENSNPNLNPLDNNILEANNNLIEEKTEAGKAEDEKSKDAEKIEDEKIIDGEKDENELTDPEGIEEKENTPSIEDIFNLREGNRELTEEELEAGLTKVELPTISQSPFTVSPFEAPDFAASPFGVSNFGMRSFGAPRFEHFSAPMMPMGAGNGEGLYLEGKKYHIITRFETSNEAGAIQPGQYFKIHLDEKLTVNNTTVLKPIIHNNETIATPEYNSQDNTITYTITKEINDNIQVPLDIPVDYNSANITLDNDGTFTVTNRVSGLGVTNPKDLIPTKVNRFGNVTNQIIEPNRKDVDKIIDPGITGDYTVNIDGSAVPVIENKELKGYNWTIKVTSDTDLSVLGYKANFTTVKGSGLGPIQNRSASVAFEPNPIIGDLGIVDSQHHKVTSSDTEITYDFFTPITNKQSAYMMDFSAILSNKQDQAGNTKVGAKRFIVDYGYNQNKIADATPTRVGINNRTTIMGEFTSENSAKWTVTDGVSTGDNGNLPLATRDIGGQLQLNSAKMAVYGLDANGKMVVKTPTAAGIPIGNDGSISLGGIPTEGTNPTGQKAGTIAVYEYDTDKDPQVDDDKKPLTLGGVSISKYENIYIDQDWSLDNNSVMPAQKIEAVDPTDENKVLGQNENVPVGSEGKTNRQITIPDVKVWTINGENDATKTLPKIKQDLPKTENGVSYYENVNYYREDLHLYYIHNRGTGSSEGKLATFTIDKVDSKDNKKGLPGATFKLLSAEKDIAEVTTDEKGQVKFSNIAPGYYTLVETKAPAGYKTGNNIGIVVDNLGKVRLANNTGNATITGGSIPTEYSQDRNYPGYMNAKYYGTIDGDGNVVAYIYLKPNTGNTNRDTRLSIVAQGGKINTVEVFDVNPNTKRNEINTAMDAQNVDEKISGLGNSVLNDTHNWDVISGTENITDPFTGKTGYRIIFPNERFINDWGFLVKITGAKDKEATSARLSFDWLTDGDNTFTANNAKIQSYINISGTDDKSDQVITVTNEAFNSKKVEVTKIDQNKNGLPGARFILRDESNNIISTVDSVENGLANFGELPGGKYTIEEDEAPDGYQKSNVIFDVIVDDAKQVTYRPRFKDGNGTPVNGYDYIIENQQETGTGSDTIVDTISENKLQIWENEPGDIGTKEGVWEAYRYESLKYNAQITLKSSNPGERFTIQFDPNLDFTQYVNEMPKIYHLGVAIADPYFDYNTNTLTYVFNDKSQNSLTTVNIEIKGIIPSKFYALNSGTYEFTNTIEPGKTVATENGAEQTATAEITADYGTYDTDFYTPAQSYYFRDVYKKGDDWYVTAIAYYNPLVDTHKGARTLSFNWASTKRRNDINMVKWPITGETPAFDLRDVKVYRVLPEYKSGKLTNEPNMPLSFGVRPEQDPGTYRLMYSRAIDPNVRIRDDRVNGFILNYDPEQIKTSGTMQKWKPLTIRVPSISGQDEGYVIEQTFKVNDMDKWLSLWRTFYMTNGSLESAFATKVNNNTALANQIGQEIPKFYSQVVKLINRSYTPGKFTIKKLNDADRSKVLSGATFSLKGEDGRIIYRTTDANGIITFDNLKPGNYTLEETTAPDGYNKSNLIWDISVNSSGVVTITEKGLTVGGESKVGSNITIEITNKPVKPNFVVYKKDANGKPLKGAKFVIKDENEQTTIATGESDDKGVVNFTGTLENNKTYIIEESEAPNGYKKLEKKWVLVIDDKGNKKVYNYRKNEGTTTELNSILEKENVNWVDVAGRSLKGWSLYDNRHTGWVDNYPTPFKMGTRIVGINKTDKYVIQRYVINPESVSIGASTATIHREKPEYPNMDWYDGNAVAGTDYQVFKLNKPVTGVISEIRLAEYGATDITNSVKDSVKAVAGKYGEPNRLSLNLSATDKPVVIDIKVPYKEDTGGVGTGIDWTENGTTYWKSDYYEEVSIIKEAGPVLGQSAGIIGSYISEGSLDVTNEKNRHQFKFKKTKANKTDAVSGATFKLQGPKIDDNNLGLEVWKRSGEDGVDGEVKFDNLLPGVYTLTETGAAQGYELADTDWTVTITEDGKVFFKANKEWQKVDLSTANPNRHKDKSSSNADPADNKIQTKITEVNKGSGTFRQVYLLNNRSEKLETTYFELHSQPEKTGLNLDNTKIVSFNIVNSIKNAKFDDIKDLTSLESVDYNTEVYVKNNQERIKITPKENLGDQKTLAIVVESKIPQSGTVGTGMDFYNFGSNHYWAAEWYNSIQDMKLLEPENRSYFIEPSTTAVSTNNITGSKQLLSAQSKDAIVRVKKQSLAEFVRNANGLEVSPEQIGGAVRGASDWETIDPARSEKTLLSPTRSTDDPVILETRMTEINKVDKKFRQVFLYGQSTYGDRGRKIQIHSQPEEFDVRANDPNKAIVKVYTVTGSNLDNIGTKTEITNVKFIQSSVNNHWRLKNDSIPATVKGNILIEVEAFYDASKGVGLGTDYISNTKQPRYSTNWIGESYASEDKINYKHLITINPSTGGKVTAVPYEEKDKTVNLNIVPDAGYEWTGNTITDKAGNVIAENVFSFTMPDKDVIVTNTFEKLAGNVTIYFNAGDGGTGTMPSKNVPQGDYKLPACTFTAPEGKEFKAWSVAGVEHQPGETINVTANTTLTAIWKNKTVDPVVVTGIEVNSTNHKTDYKVGEQLDVTNLTIKVTKSDGTAEIVNVTPDMVEGFNSSQEATNQTLTITYQGKSTTYNVNIKAEASQPTTYTIGIIPNTEHGSISAPTSAESGSTVTVTVNPDEGYIVDKIEVLDKDGNLLAQVDTVNNAFTMPENDVYLKASFKVKPQVKYDIAVEQTEGGTVTVEGNKTNASAGEEISLTVTPNQGYEVGQVTVNGKEIKSQNGKYTFTMPASNATVQATFKKAGNEIVGDEIKDDEELIITNKQAGIDLKLLKKDREGFGLPGGEFKLSKTDEDWKNPDDKFTFTATSDAKGNVVFRDNEGKNVRLQVGKYIIEEIKPPEGYKKAPDVWKVEVTDNGGSMQAKFYGATKTVDQYLTEKDPDNDTAYADSGEGTKSGITYKSKITHIDPEAKVFVQRIYIDMRNYSGSDLVNLQIIPKHKRDETDTPGQSPVTNVEGLKTAYRTTYMISKANSNVSPEDVLNSYDLSKPGVTMVNTARWRPFNWGFDEDILNLKKGEVYFIDVEGFYDDAIITGFDKHQNKDAGFTADDLKKLEMDFKFYDGAREFQQAVYNTETKEIEWKVVESPKGNYQQGNKELQKYHDAKGDGITVSELSLEGGKIVPSIEGTPTVNIKTSADISSLYASDTPREIPKEGLTITNDQETYNVTFSKHGKNSSDDSDDVIAKRRLEGAIFKLQEQIGNTDEYDDVQGSYVSSAFNGYFGFRGLKPGRYRLMEVKAPEGYKPINGPLLYFTIETIKSNQGVIVHPETGKLVDIKTIKVKFPVVEGKPVDDKEYDLTELYMVNSAGDTVKISEVDSSDISIENTEIKKAADSTTKVPLKNLSVVGNDLDENNNHKLYPISQIKIIPDHSGYISLEYDKANGVYQYIPENGKLVDFVTSATAKNMGKIVNEIPGKGRIEITKKDDENKLLPGAEFKLTRLSNTDKVEEGQTPQWVYTGTVDEKGKLIFDGLPIGQYMLEETKAPAGHQSKGQRWYFTVGGAGLDPYANDTSSGGRDLSDFITFEEPTNDEGNPKIEVQKTLSDDKTDVTNTIYPHRAQSIAITSKLKVKDGTLIQPGDYFDIKLTDSIDLLGIEKDKPLNNLDIFADGVGTVAKAKYDRDNGTIRYTFTEYARTYTLTELKTTIIAWINLNKIKYSTTDVPVGVRIGTQPNSLQTKLYTVNYDIDRETSRHPYVQTTYRQEFNYDYWRWENVPYSTYYYHNITGKIFELDRNEGTFKQYYYINRNGDSGYNNWTFRYDPYRWDNQDKEITDAKIRIMRLNFNDSQSIKNSMPESFAVNMNDPNLTPVFNKEYTNLTTEDISFGPTDSQADVKSDNTGSESYIVEVTGTIPEEDIENFETAGLIYVGGYNIAARWDLARYDVNSAEASAKLEVTAINPKNRIVFKKTDESGTTLKDAEFYLVKYDKTVSGNWKVVEGSYKTSGDDGLVIYEGLTEGKYALRESKAPGGYKKIEGNIVEFEVDALGVITRQVKNTNTSKQEAASLKESSIDSKKSETNNSLQGEETLLKGIGKAVKSVFDKVAVAAEGDANPTPVSEPIGIEPIEIINYKDVEFIKVDGDDSTKALEGAEFELWYKENETDKEYQPYKITKEGKEVTMTVTSDNKGNFKLRISKPGYYALKEIKAPDGYSKFPGWIKEFRIDNGRVQILEKDPIKASARTGRGKLLTSQIIEVDKDNKTFKARVIINPGHDDWTFNADNLRLLEKGWDLVSYTDPAVANEGQIRAAVLEEGASIDDLKDTDFKTIDKNGSFKMPGTGDRVTTYSIKNLTGKGTATGQITTTQSVVVEFQGKIKNDATAPTEIGIQIQDGANTKDSIGYSFDFGQLTGEKPLYVDKIDDHPIEVENRKAEYPSTGGIGTILFTLGGAVLMTFAGLSYYRKRRKSYE